MAIAFGFLGMAHFISTLLLTITLYTLCLLQSATGQAIDEDTIDYTIIPGFNDLRSCVRACFGTCCNGSGPDYHLGCLTNQCMCRPSELFTALQYVVDCAREGCKNFDDIQLANDSMIAYCRIKGYTKIQAATLLPTSATPTSNAGVIGGYYTLTVPEPTTVYKSHATKRVEAVFAALPRSPLVKQIETDVKCTLGPAKLVVVLLTSTFFLFSIAVGLRA